MVFASVASLSGIQEIFTDLLFPGTLVASSTMVWLLLGDRIRSLKSNPNNNLHPGVHKSAYFTETPASITELPEVRVARFQIACYTYLGSRKDF